MVKEGNENTAKTKELKKALKSDEVRDYINKNYKAPSFRSSKTRFGSRSSMPQVYYPAAFLLWNTIRNRTL